MNEIRLRATGEVISEQEYRDLHPCVAFAQVLTASMLEHPEVQAADIVLPAEPPPPSDTTMVVRDGVEQLQDGSWRQKWKLQAKPSGQVAAELFALVNRLSDSIDNLVAAAYESSQRFSQEYLRREAQARTYLQQCDAAEESNQSPPPAPRLIADYALAANVSAKEGALLTLQQAEGLYAKLELLGGLRMRKNEVKRATTAAVARALHQEIVEAIKAAAAT